MGEVRVSYRDYDCESVAFDCCHNDRRDLLRNLGRLEAALLVEILRFLQKEEVRRTVLVVQMVHRGGHHQSHLDHIHHRDLWVDLLRGPWQEVVRRSQVAMIEEVRGD